MAHHIVIIGGGPGGSGAAFEAAQRGARVTLIERDQVGGTCLNRGCIPTKTMLRSAVALDAIEHADQIALSVPCEATLDLDKLRQRKEDVVAELRSQLEAQLKRAHVELIRGEATIDTDGAIQVTDTDGENARIDPDALIIATGSEPFELPIIDHSLSRVWTSDDALELSEIPDKLIILGGGVIGVELASAYAAFGSKVTIVELADHILPSVEARIVRTLAASLKAAGIEILAKTSVTDVEQEGDRIKATLSDGTELEADILLSAIGRATVLPDGLDPQVHLNYPVKIIGDAAGGIMLAHFAEAQGECCARHLIEVLDGKQAAHPAHRETSSDEGLSTQASSCTGIDASQIPACIYTHPEIATIGLSGQEAKESGHEIASGIAKFSANGKALAEGDAVGFVSIIADRKTGKLLGAQIIGPHAVELIATIGVALAADMTIEQLVETVFAHPTVSETIKIAARLALSSCDS